MTTKTAPKAKAKTAPKAKTTPKTAPAIADPITEVRDGGGQIAFVLAGEDKIAVPAAKLKGDLLALATVGSSMAALRAALGNPPKRLANGVNARNAPQSAAAAKAAPKTDKPKTPKADKPKTPKAGQTYAIGDRANEARVGTWRHYMLEIIRAHTDRAEAVTAHLSGKFEGFSADYAGKKLDFSWALAEGYISSAA